MDFLAINPESRLDGHPLILRQPWLAITDAHIGCREDSMTIDKRDNVENLVLYHPTKPCFPIVKIHKQPSTYLEESSHSPLTKAKELEFKNQTEDDVINTLLISEPQ